MAKIAERVEASNFNRTSIASMLRLGRRGSDWSHNSGRCAWTFSDDRRRDGKVQRLHPLPNGEESPEINGMHDLNSGARLD